MNKFINTTLQLKDENIIFEDKVEEMIVKNIKSLIYFGKLDVNTQYCPACGCVKQGNSIAKNGAKKSRITLTKISGLPTLNYENNAITVELMASKMPFTTLL